ncbi:MAG TPA: potassium-transporting ATPase subunit C, partial [Propionicimonas sp.]
MTFLRQALAAVRLLLVMTVMLGIAYPLVITGVAQVIAPVQANGSTLTSADGTVVGSALIGQSFEGDQWFQGRPSASDYSG